MKSIADNLRFLRESNKLKQSEMLAAIGFAQTTWNNYEKGVSKPKIEDLINISNYFGITVDDILKKDLTNTQVIEKEKGSKIRQNAQVNAQGNTQVIDQKRTFKSVLNEPETPYFSSKMPAIVTVNQAGIDNIIFVPIKAQAGYLIGYGDREFIETLPSFQMPGLRNGTYRMFEVQGISMHPTLSNGDRVIGEFVNNIGEIRENRVHIVVTPTGVLVKRVINRLDRDGKIYLKSDTLHHRADFPIIPIDPEEILEIWYVRMAVTTDLGEPSETYQRLSDLEVTVQKITEKIGLK